MAIYTVVGMITVSCYTEIDADSESEAIQKAQHRDVADTTPHIHSLRQEWQLESDGVPYNIEIED